MVKVGGVSHVVKGGGVSHVVEVGGVSHVCPCGESGTAGHSIAGVVTTAHSKFLCVAV